MRGTDRTALLFGAACRFLDVRVCLDTARFGALAPSVDAESLQAMLEHSVLVCAGGRAAVLERLAGVLVLPQKAGTRNENVCSALVPAFHFTFK